METQTEPTAVGPRPRRERLIPLAKALRLLKANPETAWMPHSSIREAVAKGKVFSRRTPAGKYSRYYVRLSDLKALFTTPLNSG